MLSKIKAFFSTPKFNTVRAMLYVAIPAALLELVKDGHLTQDRATLWTAVALGAFSPALASIFAPNGWRTYLALVGVPVQALLVGLGGASGSWALMAAAVLGSIISSGIWASNVHNAGTPPDAAPNA